MSAETLTMMSAEDFMDKLFSGGTSSLSNIAVDGDVSFTEWCNKRGVALIFKNDISLDNVKIHGFLSLCRLSSEKTITLNKVQVSGIACLDDMTCPQIMISECIIDRQFQGSRMNAERLVITGCTFTGGVFMEDVVSKKITWEANGDTASYVNQPSLAIIMLLSKSGIVLQTDANDV